MSDDDPIDWAVEFADDPDFLAIPEQQRPRVLAMLAAFEKTLERGMAAIYGEEPADVPDAEVPCSRYLPRCGARCCSLIFALTPAEVELGIVHYNPERPYFIARDTDGLCPHLDRETLGCSVWDQRPLRCRRYDCREDREIWPGDTKD